MRLASFIAVSLAAPMAPALADNPSPTLQLKIQVAQQTSQSGGRGDHIDVLSYSWGTSSSGQMNAADGKYVAKKLPGRPSATVGGDPDRPVVAGRVPNPGASASAPVKDDEVMVSMEHGDTASGQATGKRQHKPVLSDAAGGAEGPITITKEWDAATPQLMKLDRPAAKGSVWIRTSQPWAACRVGARFPSAQIDGYQLRNLTVSSCPGGSAAEGVTLAYEGVHRVR